MTFSIDQFRLDDKVAIVTGAGGRGNSIGRAYALGLAHAGASVVVADINAEGAKVVADEIIAAGGQAMDATTSLVGPHVARLRQGAKPPQPRRRGLSPQRLANCPRRSTPKAQPS